VSEPLYIDEQRFPAEQHAAQEQQQPLLPLQSRLVPPALSLPPQQQAPSPALFSPSACCDLQLLPGGHTPMLSPQLKLQLQAADMGMQAAPPPPSDLHLGTLPAYGQQPQPT
jgi:hypothetical protein